MAKGKPSGARQQVLDLKADTAALIEQLKPPALKVASSTDGKTKR